MQPAATVGRFDLAVIAGDLVSGEYSLVVAWKSLAATKVSLAITKASLVVGKAILAVARVLEQCPRNYRTKSSHGHARCTI